MELLALCCWWFARRADAGAAFKVLGIQLLLANAVELLALTPSVLDVPVVYLYNFYLLAELGLMSWMLVLLKPDMKRMALTTNSILLCVWILEADLFSVDQRLQAFFLLLSALTLCALSSSVLWTLSIVEKKPLHTSPLFWLLLGMVLYFGGIAPVFSSFNYLARHEGLMSEQLYWIVRLLCAVRYITVAYACIQLRVRANTLVLQ